MTPPPNPNAPASASGPAPYRRGFWLGILIIAAGIHLGTSILRLNSFFPPTQMPDFASYYAGAWSMRMNLSPYPWSETLLRFLHATSGPSVENTPINSPPLWLWLLQPVTLLSFSTAAVVWLALLFLILAYCHFVMMKIAGYPDRKTALWTLPATLTFGPAFLNLTLGQNGIFLLLGALLLGEALKRKPADSTLTIAFCAWLVAVAAKIYPAFWIGCLPFLRRWRAFAAATALCLAAFGGMALLKPGMNADYWLHTLLHTTRVYDSGVSIDDQSLNGFLSRIGAPGTYAFPGLNVHEWPEVRWSWPWNFSPRLLHGVSSAILLALGALLAFAWKRNASRDPDAALYSLALFSLLLVPHMERYNHVVALPAMAWLWHKGSAFRRASIGAYGLFALSRLTHLWTTLSLPIGLFASGFGVLAVLILLLGIARSLGTLQTAPPTR